MRSRRRFRIIATLAAAIIAAAVQPALARPAQKTAALPDGHVAATDVRLGGDESRTRFIVDLSRPIELSAFTLADPYRIVLDLPQIAFQFPPRSGENGRGLIKAFRYGMVMPGGSRIVLDANGPVRIDKAFVLEPLDGAPARLVLDLVAVDRDTFLRNLALEGRPPEQPRKVEREHAAAPGDNRPVVVIDPGHGGLDAGTTAPSGEAEKTIVLEFAQQLREKLDKSGKYRVVMTRKDDTFVALGDRVRIARANQAALFISIHADALAGKNTETRGATVYTVSDTASDGEAARLAETENKADLIAGVDLSGEADNIADILLDLVQRETKVFSGKFARTLVGELKSSAKLHKHPLKSAGFKVLKAPDVPSVLVELGYVSSPEDLKLMTSLAWRQRTTDSIVQAVNAFFAPRGARGAVASGPAPR